LYESDEDIDEEADPKTFEEAWYHHSLTEGQGWRDAIRKEINDMNSRNGWRKIKKDDVPPNKRLIGCKWIFRKKKDGRYRARLCASSISPCRNAVVMSTTSLSQSIIILFVMTVLIVTSSTT
jgi:hypothetical protein